MHFGNASTHRSRLSRLLIAGLIALLLQTASIGIGEDTSAGAKTAAPSRLEKTAHGAVLVVGGKYLELEVCSEDVIRVTYATDAHFLKHPSLAVLREHVAHCSWNLKNDAGEAVLSTPKLQARVVLATGQISFFNASGEPILAEAAGGHTLTPAIVQGDETFHVRQEWESTEDEALYGLGQHQLGLMNIKGYDLDLWQDNGTVAIPFLVSSHGYGILWDNTSLTRFGDLRDFGPVPQAKLFGADGTPGGFTGSYYADARFGHLAGQRQDADLNFSVPADAASPNLVLHSALPATGSVSLRWEGEVQADETGDYEFQAFSNYGIKFWVDDQLLISAWHQRWQPWKNLAKLHLETGRHHVKLEWTTDSGGQVLRLQWKTPAHDPNTSLWSDVGEGIDYYFCYGPELDRVIAGYRHLTGRAPMMPQWAYGLWQCRQRYETAQQSLDVLAGFRSRHIPVDNIVQDWFYWKADQWGSHQFDPARFPDPAGWIREIHEKYQAHLMISVWPKFYPATENFQAMRAHGYLYESDLGDDFRDWMGQPYTFYDAFNPGARKLFWSQIDHALFSKGADAWWLDASEPELLPVTTLAAQRSHVHPTALGSGARLLNGYPLENSAAVYEGQRAAAPDRRVFILTRSGFAGQQRYAAAVWSGDISSTWTAMQAQIPAGLGFCLSGLPYWTMDIGGFAVPPRFSAANAKPEDVSEWRELNTRWFEFGTFVPLLRVHGEFPYREMWEFGGDASPTFEAELKFDRLRYRLLPYIYSLAGGVTLRGETIMRALVMDFPTDTTVLNIGDQYMFGPAFLVNPVTAYQARTRPVYLPVTDGGWFDFWTGQHFDAGQTIDAPAPYDAMPLFLRAGAIVPFGPELQYAAEKPADPITLCVYAGASGSFTLYEDQGLDNNYETGSFAEIPLHWDDGTQTLTIGKRRGTFDGMLNQRTFQIVLISKNKPVGFSFAPVADRTIFYSGKETKITLGK
jgi:alpha-D-xyloside xylohydrolase